MAVSINTQLVLSRLASFVAHFQGHRELYGGAGALVSLHGKKNEQGTSIEMTVANTCIGTLEKGIKRHESPSYSPHAERKHYQVRYLWGDYSLTSV
jgi:hypothetical protein